ncbi:unnamed protein product, partial [Amoebophrya sp. A25]|eukprot:GSA25T00024911001.1
MPVKDDLLAALEVQESGNVDTLRKQFQQLMLGADQALCFDGQQLHVLDLELGHFVDFENEEGSVAAAPGNDDDAQRLSFVRDFNRKVAENFDLNAARNNKGEGADGDAEQDEPPAKMPLLFEDVEDTFELLRIQALPVLPQRADTPWVYPGRPGRVSSLNIRHYLESCRAKNLKEDRNPFEGSSKSGENGDQGTSKRRSSAILGNKRRSSTTGVGGTSGVDDKNRHQKLESGATTAGGHGSPRVKQRRKSVDVAIAEALGQDILINLDDDDDDIDDAHEEGPKRKKPGGDRQKKEADRKVEEEFQVGKNSEMQFVQYSQSLALKALPHPSPVSEPLAIANVSLPRVRPSFELRIPWILIERGLLSSQQLETITFAAMRLDDARSARKCPRMNAYLLGDGTGCGKGRVISALIIHNWHLGIKRHIWVSATAQLLEDARRDLRDLEHGHIPVMSLPEWIDRLQRNNPIHKDLGAVIRKKCSFDKLRKGERCPLLDTLDFEGIDGIVFLTYNKLARDVKKEVVPLLHWFTQGEAADFVGEVKSITGGEVLPGADISSMNSKNNAFNENKRRRVMEELSPGGMREELALCESDDLFEDGVGAGGGGKKSKKNKNTTNRAQSNAQIAQRRTKRGPLPGLGILAFDEAHKAKHLVVKKKRDGSTHTAGSSKIGLAVRDWQELYCRNAKVVYASATAATEVANMGYMSRLGLWGEGKVFKTFNEFSQSISSGGVTAMEVVAINLKAYGVMSCRGLSYCGCEFSQIPMELTDAHQKVYDSCSELVRMMKEEFAYFLTEPEIKALYTVAVTKVGRKGDVDDLMDLDTDEESEAESDTAVRRGAGRAKAKAKSRAAGGKRNKNSPDVEPALPGREKATRELWRQFWSFQQRFYKHLLVCFKVSKTVDLIDEAMAANEQVVVSLWTTGESRIQDYLNGGDGGDEDGVKKSEIELLNANVPSSSSSRNNHNRAGCADDNSPDVAELLSGPRLALDYALDTFFLVPPFHYEAKTRKERLKKKLDDFAHLLPANALDHLIEKCGGPAKVAEISGRTKRMTRDVKTGQIRYELRTAADPLTGRAVDVPNVKQELGVPAVGPSVGGASSSSSSSSGAAAAQQLAAPPNGGGGASSSSSSANPFFSGVSVSADEYAQRMRAGTRNKAAGGAGGGGARGLRAVDKKKAKREEQGLLNDLSADITLEQAGISIDGAGVGDAGLGGGSRRLPTGSAALNIAEQFLFQSGKKRIAVITEAGSTGISLHCERR